MHENKQVVVRFLEALGQADIPALAGLMAPGSVAICTGTCALSGSRGRETILGTAGLLKQVTKNGIRFHIVSMTAEDDRVSAEMRGECELVNGAVYNNEYHFLFTVKDGQITMMKEYLDTRMVDDILAPLFASAMAG